MGKYNKMHFKVLVVLAVSAIIAVDGGVLKREKRTLGLVKYAAAHPVKAAAALIGKYALYKFLKGKKVAPAPAPASPDYEYWYEPLDTDDSEPWVDVDPAENLPESENVNSSPYIGVQGGFEAGPFSINAGISAGRR